MGFFVLAGLGTGIVSGIHFKHEEYVSGGFFALVALGFIWVAHSI